MRTFCLAALATAVAMAVVGASSATATTLCKVEETPCASKNQVKSLHLKNAEGSVEKILNSTATVLCLNVLKQIEVQEPAEHQESKATSLTFSGCGTDASHNNCTVQATGQIREEHWYQHSYYPYRTLFLILNGRRSLKCTIFGFVKIECEFDEAGLMAEVEEASEGSNGLIAIEESPLSLVGGKLCPEEATVDAEYKPSEPLYVSE